jgi:predicted Zn-dependent protease
MDRVVAFTEILSQNPQDAFARYGLAMEYVQRQQLELALGQFDHLQSMHPDYTPGYQMAAQTLLASGRIEEAVQRLEAGIACAERTGNQHAVAEMQGMLDEVKAGK